MTTVYFVRHAKSNRFAEDDRTRPLTDEGLSDTLKITEALSDKGISHILSSPYKRTVQTVTDLSERLRLSIETDEDFRERNAGQWRGDNFLQYIKAQWDDFNFSDFGGECLANVQERNVNALNKYLKKYSGETIAIATHGTALSTMINYYYPDFRYDGFMRIIDFMPYVVKMEFDNENRPVSFEEILIIKKEYNKQ